MKRCVEVKVDGAIYRLRLGIAAQKRLEDAYKNENMATAAIIYNSIDNPIMMAKVLGECLRWKGSGNDESVTGVDLYEALMDDGQLDGTLARAELMTQIAVSAGIITAEQAEAVKDGIKAYVDETVSSVSAQNKEAPEADENPPTP